MATTKQQLINEVNAELAARLRIWSQTPDSTRQNPVFIIENYNRRYSHLLKVKTVLEALPEYLIEQVLSSSESINFLPQTSGQAELF